MKKYTGIVAKLAFLGCVALCFVAATSKDHHPKKNDKVVVSTVTTQFVKGSNSKNSASIE